MSAQELVTIIRFTYPHEAAIAKGLLESEEIEVFTKDEFTVQVHNFMSNAMGGIRLQVWENDVERAVQILSGSTFHNHLEHVRKDTEPASENDPGTQKPKRAVFPIVIILVLLILLIYFILL